MIRAYFEIRTALVFTWRRPDSVAWGEELGYPGGGIVARG